MAVKVTLDNTLGAAFLGTMAACLLIGISIVQTHSYYRNYPRDWMFQKIAVGVLMVFLVLITIFTIHAMYFYLITNFGNPKGLETVIWSFKMQVLFNTFIILSVQGLYALRVWKLGSNFSRIWPGVVGFVVAGGWAVGFFALSHSMNQTDFTDLDEMRGTIPAMFAVATAIDIIIAGSMCYYLNRSRSSFAATNNKIFTVMRYVLITGFLTSACSLATLITYVTMPDNLVFIGINLLLPILYANSYIAMLNARKSMNEKETSGSDVSKALHIKSGTTLRTDFGQSVDDKDGIPLSARFTSSTFSNKYDLEQSIPSKHVGIEVHRTEERKYDQN
ncbi:hypothetical protein M413DRAFT_245084 [Hebeloma cylindrosporum]|uniref:DUF6534 domain-containing protein n=1 Tax=Hebeloma cylindrosporum TaxID=76867 RepID=A0A0C3C252_HEBCY|nr:hypothetical protein M413DRAFT_245084 [Hebeloma cylindrosporum h7]